MICKNCGNDTSTVICEHCGVNVIWFNKYDGYEDDFDIIPNHDLENHDLKDEEYIPDGSGD